MAVFRVEKNANFTAMSNYHLRDSGLSLKAKGLLSVCLSLPENWDYSVNGLVAILKEGRDSVLSTIQELEREGYITRRQTRTPDGKMGRVEYCIYEKPKEKPQVEKPQSEKPTTDKPVTELPASVKPITENPVQISTDIKNTDLTKHREKKEDRHQYGQYKNVLFSDEEFEKVKYEFPNDYNARIERLSEYMASTGKAYKSHLATIRSWARREEAKRSYNTERYCFEEGESL